MRFLMQKSPALARVLSILCLAFLVHTAHAQVDLTLSLTDLMNWQPSASNAANISNTPLQQRTRSLNQQIHSNMDTNIRILYSPDGMDNFGPYVDSSTTFNLFNFTHWQYVDMLAWFGGTASIPVLIPAKAWVDAAHQNGVKVIGCVFFAPQAWGGNETTLQNFLVKDSNGSFTAANQLIEIANYYQFDGWLLNFETNVSSGTATLAMEFLDSLNSSYSGEIIWYDAMLTSGTVSWQNQLNAANSYFFENATGMFTNYWWGSGQVANSNAHATGLGRSPYDVYMGADMWPGRNNQPAFNDYTWIDQIFSGGNAQTSIALYATNFTFNNSSFSNFNNDPNDVDNFNAAERAIFSGIDYDPFIQDNQWKGISHYVPVRTTITSLPFQTDFNLGHGLNYYHQGSIAQAGSWHNMSLQSTLPSWTFQSSGVAIDYDYSDAYHGGSSLGISGMAGTYSIPLYSTYLMGNALRTGLTVKTPAASTIDSIAVELVRSSGSPSVLAVFYPSQSGSWESFMDSAIAISGSDTISAVNLIVYANSAFSINIGEMSIDGQNTSMAIEDHKLLSTVLPYPNPGTGNIRFSGIGHRDGVLTIYQLNGEKVLTRHFQNGKPGVISFAEKGVYLYEITSENQFKRGKIIIR